LQCPFLCWSLWNSYSVLSLDGFPGHFLGFIWGFWHSFALFNCVVLISPTYLSFTVGFFLQPDATKSRRSRLRAFGGRLWLGLPSFVLDLCVGPDGWTAHLLHAMAFDSLISLGFCNLWGFDLELIILYSSFSLFWFISFFFSFSRLCDGPLSTGCLCVTLLCVSTITHSVDSSLPLILSILSFILNPATTLWYVQGLWFALLLHTAIGVANGLLNLSWMLWTVLDGSLFVVPSLWMMHHLCDTLAIGSFGFGLAHSFKSLTTLHRFFPIS